MVKLDLGISANDFFNDHFELRPYFKPNALSGETVALTDIEGLISTWDATDSRLRVFLNGAVPGSDYMEVIDDVDGQYTRFIPEKFQALLSAGATLVLNRVDTKLPLARHLCAVLMDFLREPVVANAYLAYGGSGTFGKHWDTHDVIAVQLLGRKRWRVFRPTHPLPLRGQTSKHHKPDCPTEAVFDADLEAGDALYIPRGWWHEATPYQRQTSLHISAGIHTRTVSDYLAWFCSEVAPDIAACRRAVRGGAETAQAISDALTALTTRFADDDVLAQFLSQRPALTFPHEQSFLPSFDFQKSK